MPSNTYSSLLPIKLKTTTQKPCVHQSGLKQNGSCPSCLWLFLLNFILTLPWQPLTVPRAWTIFLQYCLLLKPSSHPGSSQILDSPGVVSSPFLNLDRGAKHSWKKLAPFLNGILAGDLSALSISSALIISLRGLYGSAKSPPYAIRWSSSDMLNCCNDSSLRACLPGVVTRVKASDISSKGPIFTSSSGSQHFTFSFWWRGGKNVYPAECFIFLV